MLPLEYNGDIKYLKIKLDIIFKQCPIYTNMIEGYFYYNKIKFFENNIIINYFLKILGQIQS